MTGYLAPTKKVRVADLKQKKRDGEKWAMLTAYDYSTARVFAEAGIECMLVGDSAANVVYGYETTNQVSAEEMTYLAAAVVRGAGNALVVADLPFGSYEASDEQCVRTATEMIRRSGAHMVKLEGGVRIAPRIKALKDAGLAVCAHVGFTPQSVDNLSASRSKAAMTAPTSCGPTPTQSSKLARTWSFSRWSRPSWPKRSPPIALFPPSASALARTRMRKCWSGTIWPISRQAATARVSCANSVRSARHSAQLPPITSAPSMRANSPRPSTHSSA